MDKKPRCCRGEKLPPAMVETAKVNAVLSDGNRLRILCLLKDGERCVCEIWMNLALPQNLTSHHLKTLKNAGLLRSRRDGLRIYYSLNKAALKKAVDVLDSFTK